MAPQPEAMSLEANTLSGDMAVRTLFDSAPPLADVLADTGDRNCALAARFEAKSAHRDYLLRALRLSAQLGPQHARLRFWVDGAKTGDAETLKLVRSVWEEDSFPSWTGREWGDKEISIVIGQLEAIDEELAIAAARYIRPHLLAIEQPLAIALGVFAGRYAYSAFGIHCDVHLERVLHFHAGPGAKTLLVWPDKNDVQGLIGKFPDDEALETAQSLNAEAGDMLSVVSPTHHIGSAPEPCTNLCLLFTRFKPMEMLVDLARELNWWRRDGLDSETNFAVDPVAYLPEAWRQQSMARVMEEAMWLKRLASLSNGGLAASPLPRKWIPARGQLVRLAAPEVFPLLFAESFGQTVMAARGKLRPLPDHKGLLAWCEALAAGETMEADELLTGPFSRDGTAQAGFVLQWLHQSGAIRFNRA